MKEFVVKLDRLPPRPDEPDVVAYRCDVFVSGNDFHGIGATPQGAMLQAASFWAGYERRTAPDEHPATAALQASRE